MSEGTYIRRPNRALGIYAVVFLVVLYLPILFIPLFSFNQSIHVRLPIEAFSLQRYHDLFRRPDVWNALGNSLRVGPAVAVVSTVLGLPTARAIARHRVPGRSALVTFVMLPLVVAGIIFAVALLIFVNRLGVPLSLSTVALGHLVICLPFAVATLLPRFEGFDEALVEASAGAGRNPVDDLLAGDVAERAARRGGKPPADLHGLVRRIHRGAVPVGNRTHAAHPHLDAAAVPARGALGPGAVHPHPAVLGRARLCRASDRADRRARDARGRSRRAMSGAGVLISIRNAVKAFGRLVAVDDVSLDIRQGEFFSLLGASGSGKTTLLRMIAGLEATTSGEILIDGRPMSRVPPYRRPVGMVFQHYAIFPHLDVRGNIAYGLRRQGLSRAQSDALVEEMLELVKLPGYGARRPNQLSGGQRRRVALARALILRPRVLLLDEPLGALDRQLREQMQIELVRFQRAVGITFVFVTHDQEEALTLSDRVAVMADGRVLQVDTPDGLYEAPQSRRVAGFVGTMNFLQARVAARSAEGATLEIEGLGRRDIDAGCLPRHAGGALCLAIRPERLALRRSAPDAGVPAVAGTVEARVYPGERSHYHVRVAGRDAPLAVSAQNASRLQDAPVGEGSRVWLTWGDADLIPLDPD